MKVFVMYDESGTIKGTLAVPRGKNIGIRPGPGTTVHTFEHEDLDDKKLQEYLSKLHDNHRIDVAGSGGARVVARESASR